MERTTNPLCADCLDIGLFVPATEVHHLTSRSRGGELLSDDLLPLCKSDHSIRTARGE